MQQIKPLRLCFSRAADFGRHHYTGYTNPQSFVYNTQGWKTFAVQTKVLKSTSKQQTDPNIFIYCQHKKKKKPHFSVCLLILWVYSLLKNTQDWFYFGRGLFERVWDTPGLYFIFAILCLQIFLEAESIYWGSRRSRVNVEYAPWYTPNFQHSALPFPEMLHAISHLVSSPSTGSVLGCFWSKICFSSFIQKVKAKLGTAGPDQRKGNRHKKYLSW